MGAHFDKWLALNEYFVLLILRAQLQLGVLPRLLLSFWGPGNGSAADDPWTTIVSPLRAGVVVAGSCYPPDRVAKMETEITNIAARQIGGLGPTTCIEAAHAIPGTTSYKNSQITHCATLMDAALRARDSAIATNTGRGGCYLGND